MAHGVTPEALEQALARPPGHAPRSSSRRPITGWPPTSTGAPRSPTRAGAALIVDNAWGAHFGFHPRLPPSPLALGADAMLASTHKIVGSLTQSAMLLIAHTELMDTDAVARAVRLVRSTSQSSLLMASLDAARRQLAVHGEALLDRTIRAADARPGGDRRGRGMRRRGGGAGRASGGRGLGPAADRDRRARHRLHRLRGRRCAPRVVDIYVELATHATLVLVLGLGQTVDPLERLSHDFAETVRAISRPGRTAIVARPPVTLSTRRRSLRARRFWGRGSPCRSTEAIGRISAESIAGYPPGVPRCCPGSGSPPR